MDSPTLYNEGVINHVTGELFLMKLFLYRQTDMLPLAQTHDTI